MFERGDKVVLKVGVDYSSHPSGLFSPDKPFVDMCAVYTVKEVRDMDGFLIFNKNSFWAFKPNYFTKVSDKVTDKNIVNKILNDLEILKQSHPNDYKMLVMHLKE